LGDMITLSLGSFLLGFLGFGIGGTLLLKLLRNRKSWSAESSFDVLKIAFLTWGLYQFFIFMRFIIEYVLTIPYWTIPMFLDWSTTAARITQNPFVFGINPLGYFAIDPFQAIVTWLIELAGAFLFIRILGALGVIE